MTDHDGLLDRLRRAAAAADPPPPELEGSARAAFGLSRLDAELATLLHDSEQESVAVRGGGDEPHLLSFGSDDVGADLEISPPRMRTTSPAPCTGRCARRPGDAGADPRPRARRARPLPGGRRHGAGGAGADGDRVRRHGRHAVGPARLRRRAGRGWTRQCGQIRPWRTA